MGQLVAERVDQARVLEGSTGAGVVETDLDGAVGKARSIAAPHPGSLCLE